jgi:NAD(P)-dependent dehydrogenase (short-subunit alcohol dehydrogenase family)
MQEVEGKVAFITGGAAGMGLGMAHAFARAGMKVAIADIRREALDKAMAGFEGTNLAVHPIELDVTDRKGFERAADETERVFGKVHLLCNNAGLGIMGPIKQATYDDWDWITGVILGGTINGVQTFLPRILAHGEGGHIVNTASLSGVLATPGMGVYVTAKYAVVGMAEALRTELAPDNIGVSAFIAGATHTDIRFSHRLRPAGVNSGYAHNDEVLEQRAEALNERPGWMKDPMEVGEIVLRGVRRNDLYIWPTAHYRDGVRYRMEALTRGMPDNEVDAATRKRTSNFNDIQIYLDQQQVPPWEDWD